MRSQPIGSIARAKVAKRSSSASLRVPSEVMLAMTGPAREPLEISKGWLARTMCLKSVTRAESRFLTWLARRRRHEGHRLCPHPRRPRLGPTHHP